MGHLSFRATVNLVRHEFPTGVNAKKMFITRLGASKVYQVANAAPTPYTSRQQFTKQIYEQKMDSLSRVCVSSYDDMKQRIKSKKKKNEEDLVCEKVNQKLQKFPL